MEAGRLDTRITLQRKQTNPHPVYGSEQVPAWETVAECWAMVTDTAPSRSEDVIRGLAVARDQTRIRIRWRNDITSDMRVIVHRHGTDTIMQIVGGPADVGARRELVEMVCERYSS